MATKKTTVKKATVKKPVMKRGGTKKSLPKAQLGTPFQQYMKIPGAVASDTSNIYNTPKKGSTLDNAFSATFGNDYQQKAIDYNTLEKFRGDNSEYKKPLKKGTVLKKTGGAVKKIAKKMVNKTVKKRK